jgi:hypothetical protein
MSPAARAQKLLVLAGLCLGLPSTIFAQATLTPTGGEYPVTGPINGEQLSPAISIAPAGGWVVWQDNGIDGKGYGIGARKLDHNASPAGGYFRVNNGVAGDQEKPRVTVLDNGGAAVVWQGGRLGFQNVYVRFLNPDGSFATQDILVNEPAGNYSTRFSTNITFVRNNKPKLKSQRLKHNTYARLERTGNAGVTKLADGSVIVAYAAHRQISTATQVPEDRVKRRGTRDITNTVFVTVRTFEDNMQDVYFQRFGSDGEKIGGLTRVNQFTDLNQHHPAIAPLADGGFVIAWANEQQHGVSSVVVSNTVETVPNGPGYTEIFARVFAADGTPVTDEFRVNTAERPCNHPSVAAAGSSGFLVSWTQKDAVPSNSLDIWARSYSDGTNDIGAPILVNATTFGDQFGAQSAALPGGQIVVWTSLQQDGSREGVFGRYIVNGALSGAEFRVNTTTNLRQFMPAVGSHSGGQAVVIWSSYQTEAAFDLFGQRYTAQ